MNILPLQPADVFLGKEHFQTCNIGDIVVDPEFYDAPWQELVVPDQPTAGPLSQHGEKIDRAIPAKARRLFRRVRVNEVVGWQRTQ